MDFSTESPSGSGSDGPASAIKKLAIPLLVFGLAGALLYYAFYLQPRTVDAVVSVVELDTRAGIPAVEVTLSLDDEVVTSGVTEGDGSVRLTGLTSGRTYYLSAYAGSRYSGGATTLEITREGGNAQLVLARKRPGLKLTGSVPVTPLTQNCEQTYTLQVSNEGTDPQDVRIVLDAPAEVQATSSPVTVEAGQTTDIPVRLSTNQAPEGDIRGAFRIEATRGEGTSLSFSIPLSKALEIEVTPGSITCARGTCPTEVIVKNKGKATVRDLSLLPRGDNILVAYTGVEDAGSGLIAKELGPGKEVRFGVTVTATSAALAWLDLTTTCFSKSITVKTG